MKKIFAFTLSLVLFSCGDNEEIAIKEETYTPIETLSRADICVDCCKCLSLSTAPLPWDYPAKPGTEEWNQLKSHQEKIDACQIPGGILLSLSTENLTRICVQYPLLYDIFAFSFFPTGGEILFDDFNGIRELFKRENASKELLKHYNYMTSNLNFLGVDETIFVQYMMANAALEWMLGFYSQEVNITTENYRDILRCLVIGYIEKYKLYVDFPHDLWYQANFYARAHVIDKICPQCLEKLSLQDRNSVLYGGKVRGKEIRDIINELSYQLIN